MSDQVKTATPTKPESVLDTLIVQDLLQWDVHPPSEVLYKLVVPHFHLDKFVLGL